MSERSIEEIERDINDAYHRKDDHEAWLLLNELDIARLRKEERRPPKYPRPRKSDG
jgi:tmRNA-binding protein